MNHFKQFQLQDFLLEGLDKLGINNPTPVQLQTIPIILQGKDVIGQSQTGTGKTLAYVLPLLEKIELGKQELQAVILAPTRELTRQIADTIDGLGSEAGLDTLLIQGGTDINRQIQRLKRNPQIIVGTPGRVMDLVKREKITSHTAKYLVLDEADTMLEMGFREDLENIITRMKKNVQIMLFAATFPPKVASMAKQFMNQPRHIEINPGEKSIDAIENIYFRVRNGGKEKALIDLLRIYNPYLGIVFVKKKEQVEELVTQLRQLGFEAEGLHGDMQRGQRKQVMQRFMRAKSQVLVATDIASRGLDIEGITHIFNFDLPINLEQYIHRIGRTGRAGNSGVAINIIVASEEEKLKAIEAKLGQKFSEKSITPGGIGDKAKKVKHKFPEGEKVSASKPAKKKFTGPNAKKKAIKEAQKRQGIKAARNTKKH